jgi:hypothetical protein
VKSLRLTVHHTEATIHPVHEFVCESDAVQREYLLHGNTTTDPVSFLFYVVGDREAYEDVVASISEVVEYDITPGGEGFYLYVRERASDHDETVFEALQSETIVTVPPVEFRPDRTMRLTAIGHPERLREAIDALPDGMQVDLERVGEYGPGGVGGLTDRQREAVAVAREAGYYEVPRRTELAIVADELGVAESTASTLLRKAEARLVDRAIGE